MVYKKAKRALIAAGIAFCASSTAMADGMTGASADMLSNTCAGCHGTHGASAGPATPTIAGLSAYYFEEVMMAFKSGDTQSTIMGRIAGGYSEDEIKKMAEYFAGQKFVAAKQDFDADAAKKGADLHDKYCEKCHSEGATLADDDAGILAGQWTPYVKWTLQDFQDGHREMSKKMAKKLNELVKKEGDDGLHAVISFYASQQ